MAHSFRFIYWKVCCYFCIRPKKRRKKQKPLTAFYRAPIVRPCAATNLKRGPPPPLCSDKKDSATESSTSTFCTAQATSDGMASTSPPSSPVASQQHSPSPYALGHQPWTDFDDDRGEVPASAYRNQDSMDLRSAPVIANKYALQNGNDPPTLKDVPIFTIRPCDDYSVPISLPSFEGIWKSHLHPPTTADDESVVMSTQRVDDDEDDDEEEEVNVPMWLCTVLVISYICGGAVLFAFWEKWNFLDSSYFCFVTLTTIGFGDLVPGTAVVSDDNQLTLGLCSLYLLFGMALLAMSFNLVQEEVTRTVKCIGQRIGIVSDDEDD